MIEKECMKVFISPQMNPKYVLFKLRLTCGQLLQIIQLSGFELVGSDKCVVCFNEPKTLLQFIF